MFQAGDAVEIFGVTSDTTLNGQKANIVKWDAQNVRFIVKMESTGKGKALKVENLRLAGKMGNVTGSQSTVVGAGAADSNRSPDDSLGRKTEQ